MKYPLKIKCLHCSLDQVIFLDLDEMKFTATCQCGYDLSAVLADFPIGEKLLERSRYEYLNNSDYSLCIVFAAAAFECQLSRLFFRWGKIDAIDPFKWLSDQELEESLRRFANISLRIEETAKLIYPNGLNAFVSTQSDLIDMIKTGFTKLNLSDLATSFQKVLFWPRNRILHLGDTKFSPDEAKYCFNTARLGLLILRKLDEFKLSAS